MIALIAASGSAVGTDLGTSGTVIAVVLSAAAALYTAIGQRKTSKGDQSLARLEALTDNLQEDNRIVREMCDKCETKVDRLANENRLLRATLRQHGIRVPELPNNGGTR